MIVRHSARQCVRGKQSDFFQRMSLPVSFLVHFENCCLSILKVKERKIYLLQQSLGFVKNVREALKTSTPVQHAAEGILTVLNNLY